MELTNFDETSLKPGDLVVKKINFKKHIQYWSCFTDLAKKKHICVNKN